MKNRLVMSLVAVGLLGFVNTFAAEDLSSMIKEGKTSGQIRMFYINRDDNTKADNQIATAIGGHLKFETADYKGLSFGTAFYTTNRVLQDMEKDVVGPNTTLLKNDGSSYSILGEAYLQYVGGNTTVKVGRQKLDTPLAGSDDARMLPNLFEAYVLINKDVPDTTLIAAHVTKMAPGTFANAYNGGVVGATAGYTAVAGNTAKYQGEFTNMGSWAVGKETDGVTAAAAIYAPSKNIKVQLWDYYTHNILNAVYGEVNVGWKCLLTDAIKPSFSAQLIKEDAIGERIAVNDLNSLYAAGKFNIKAGDADIYVAYSEQSKADSVSKNIQKSTISAWGGMPAYTQGMVTRHQFIAGTKATKVAATYDFKNLGANVKATAYYAQFDMDSNSGLGNITTKEPGFDIIYNPEVVKDLQLRLRGNFPTDFTANRDWNEFRFIANYNF